MITILNTADMTFSTGSPLGFIESIWGVVKIEVESVQLFEKLVFYTSNGLYTGMLTSEGEFQSSENVYFKDCNVTNAAIIKDNLLLCTMNDQEGISKLMTVDVDEEVTELIIDQKENFYSFDLQKVPGTGDDAYFILH